MGMFDALVTGGQLFASTPGPTDDHWYNPVGVMTAAGLKVDEEGARKMSAWYRGRDIIATSVAMMPLKVYRRLPNDEGREPATSHPLYDILHRKPNAWQDAFQYMRAAIFDVIDHGWHYAKIIEGPRGFVDQLHPISPKLVTPELTAAGRWIFTVRDPKNGTSKTYTQDEIFYFRGADGKGILEYARDSLGLGITLENYASKLFSRGAMSGGVVTTPGPMPEPDKMKAFAAQFVTGRGDWHVPKVIPFGATFAATMMEPEKAQMILSRQFSVKDMARWLGLALHMLNEGDAGATVAEQRGEEFVTYSLGGWLAMVEHASNDQLILAPQTYFAEFTRDALVRGDLASRWEAYVSGVNAGILTPNEPRRKENLRALPGGDTLREPQNITGKGAKGGPQDNQRPGRKGDPDDKAAAFARSNAARVLQLEITAVQRLAVKHGNNADAFAVAVTDFYASHVARVAEMLLMGDADAQGYCAGQSSQVLAGWLTALELFKTEDYAAGLASWALETAA
jgi:HK97 family phage portal protein